MFVLQEGKQCGEMVPVDELLNRLSGMRYTWRELQERPLPDGVDPLCLEAYLHDDEFQVQSMGVSFGKTEVRIGGTFSEARDFMVELRGRKIPHGRTPMGHYFQWFRFCF